MYKRGTHVWRALGVAVLLDLPAALNAQSVPAWFLAVPDDPGLIAGRGAAERGQATDAAALGQARREAMRDLATSLLCRISTEIIDHQEDDASGLQGRFASRTVVEAALELVNVRTVHETLTRDMAFAQVAVERGGMLRAYRDRTTRLFGLALEAFERAGALEAEAPREALRAYEASLAALREAVDSLQVYMALNQWTHDVPMPEGLPDAAGIKASLHKLASATPRRLDEIAGTLATELAATRPPDTRSTWTVLPVEFGQTGFVSDFGHALTAALTTVLAGRPGIRVTDNPARADVILRGRMLREGDGVLLLFHAGDTAISHYIEPVTCAAIGFERIEPQNLEQLLADKLALHKAMTAPEGLRVELRTDRLHDGPVTFRFGDEPRLAVRADRACVIRLIYVTADGKRLLLLDRHPIAEHQANRWVRLPLEIVVTEPAGVEQMILQAATDQDDARLPPLAVRNVSVGEGFYLPVIQDTLDEAMTRTRGIMLRKPSHFAEVVSQWTIFAE